MVTKKSILLVEDDPLLVKMYKTKFELEGFEMLIAEDGLQALEVVRKRRPDFLILDVMMPRLSGIEFLEKIKQDANLNSIPVIMLSNLSQPSEREKAKKLGVKEFLLKANYTPSQVAAFVKKYLS